MVFLILTRAGYEQLFAQMLISSPIWLNAGILSASELAQLRKEGKDVSEFSKAIDFNDYLALMDAIDTVQEHHATERVWVEHVPSI